jgi:hypothetical protein
MSKSDFRQFVPKMGTSRHFGLSTQAFLDSLSEQRWARRRTEHAKVMATPYRGVTTGGDVLPGLYELRDEGAPTAAAVEAASRFLSRLTPQQRSRICLPLDNKERHAWQNGIAHHEDFGLRLDIASPELRGAAMAVVEASLSAGGYQRSRNIMKLNGFLGELVGAPLLLGEWSYQLHLYGEPSPTEPWGWQLSGHHLCLTCFIMGGQMTLTPTFMGAEPRHADEGQYAGVSAFDDEERMGLQFAQSLSAAQRRQAVVFDTILPNGLPPGRHHPLDGLTLGGAYQDNRIVPYEGLVATGLDARQQKALMDLAQCYLSTLPDGPLRAKMDDFERHLADTHFCWAGGMEEDSVFYYRIQSPVAMIEFDHHQGVVLDNKEPQRFHVHTIVRTPNGNDYGMDLLRLHYETAPHHRHDHHHGDGNHHHHHDDHDHGHAHHHDHGHHGHGHRK